MYRLSCLHLWSFSSSSQRGMLSSSISLMASLMSDASSFIQSSGISSFHSMRKLCKTTDASITSRMEDKSCFWADCFIIIEILHNRGSLPFHLPIVCSDSTCGFDRATQHFLFTWDDRSLWFLICASNERMAFIG